MNYRIVTNGNRFKIQHRSVEGVLFKKEVWNDMGRVMGMSPGGLMTTYYDKIEDVKKVFNELVEYDSRLTEWTEVKV